MATTGAKGKIRQDQGHVGARPYYSLTTQACIYYGLLQGLILAGF